MSWAAVDREVEAAAELVALRADEQQLEPTAVDPVVFARLCARRLAAGDVEDATYWAREYARRAAECYRPGRR